MFTFLKSDADTCQKKWSFTQRHSATFRGATTGFPAKWGLRNERRNSILMTCYYPDLTKAPNWSCRVGNLFQQIKSTTQIWVVTCLQYGISGLVSQTSFRGETSGGVVEWWRREMSAIFPGYALVRKAEAWLINRFKDPFDWPYFRIRMHGINTKKPLLRLLLQGKI